MFFVVLLLPSVRLCAHVRPKIEGIIATLSERTNKECDLRHIAAGMIPVGTGQMAISIGRREFVAALTFAQRLFRDDRVS
jgi:hypothetical protein